MKTNQAFFLREGTRILIIPLAEIIVIKTEEGLTVFEKQGGEITLCHCGLSTIKRQLPDNFFQINRTTIINLNQMSSFHFKNLSVSMKNRKKYQVSTRRKKGLKEALEPKNQALKYKNSL